MQLESKETLVLEMRTFELREGKGYNWLKVTKSVAIGARSEPRAPDDQPLCHLSHVSLEPGVHNQEITVPQGTCPTDL